MIAMKADRTGVDSSLARVQQIVTRLKLVTAPSRQKILMLLAQGERNVGDICLELGNPSQPAVSHQLSLLRHGRLIESERQGRNVIYRLTESGRSVADAFEALARFDDPLFPAPAHAFAAANRAGLGIELEHRPAFFQTLLPQFQELRARTGRPHWVVVDEAHHLRKARPGVDLCRRYAAAALIFGGYCRNRRAGWGHGLREPVWGV